MTIPLGTELTEKMQGYLNSFIHAMQGDSDSRHSFVSTLSTLHDRVLMQRDKLQIDTLLAIQGFASVIISVASNALELEKETEKLHNELIVDVSTILDREMGKLSIHDEQIQGPPIGEIVSRFPSYIKPSYEWLLSNLHNPYPPKEFKRNIARQARCSLKDVDSWFIDARKRIGWNKFRRQKFSNKQENIIAAATQFFKPSSGSFIDDIGANLDLEGDFNDMHHAEFAAMENAARSLYAGKFVDLSSSITHPSRQVSSTTSSTPSQVTRRKERDSFSDAVSASIEPLIEAQSSLRTLDAVFPYPTPEPSPRQSVGLSPSAPIPLLLPSKRPAHPRKRRQASLELFEEGVGDSITQYRKRFRPDTRESAEPAEIIASSLLSPAPTSNYSEHSSEDNFKVTLTDGLPALVILPSSAKRKRRLSDGDSGRPNKRPHHALAVPRLQAVSDPFPIFKSFTNDSIDAWFYNNFSAERQLTDAIPSPANLDVHDLPVGVPLEVHYDISPYQYAVTLPQTSFLAQDNVVSPEETLIPDKTSLYSTPESLLIPNSLPVVKQVNTAEIASAAELSLPSDFKFPSTVEETTSQDIPFNPLDQILNFTPLLQLPPADFNWMQLPLNGSVNVVEPSATYMAKNPIIFDSIIHQGSIIPEDQDTKRLRLQFLREELQLLESEVSP